MIDKLRDWLGYRLANLALKIATPHYRQFAADAVQYGMAAALRDQLESNDAPPRWEEQAALMQADGVPKDLKCPIHRTNLFLDVDQGVSTWWCAECDALVVDS